MKWLVGCCLSLVCCAWNVAAAGDCCARCGCQGDCSKVCRVVCDVKKVTKPVYDCECEDFCVPGKSQRCVTCDECGDRKIVYTPTCGTVRTRAKLVKRQETKEVKSYKWVVEDLCSACAGSGAAHDAPSVVDGSADQRGSQDVRTASHTHPLAAEPPPAAAPDHESRAGAKTTSPLRRALGPLLGRQ